MTGAEALLSVHRPLGVAARARCGACVNTLGFGHGVSEPDGFGQTFGIGFLHRVGRRRPCQARLPLDPNGALIKVAGTKLGMMLANIPVVIAGDRIAGKILLKAIRMTPAVVFAAQGIITLLG